MIIKNTDDVIQLSPEEEDMIYFYIKLYPYGYSFEQEIIDTKEENQMTWEIAKECLTDQIKNLIMRGNLSIKEIKEENGFHEKYIVLTQKGVKIVWEYMDKILLKSNPKEYIRILKEWARRDDQTSINKYIDLLLTETNGFHNILQALLIQSTKTDILKRASIIEGFDNSNKERIMEIINFLNTGISFGMITYLTNEDKSETYYQLTETGVEALRLINNKIVEMNENEKKEAINQKSIHPNSNTNIKKQIPINIFKNYGLQFLFIIIWYLYLYSYNRINYEFFNLDIYTFSLCIISFIIFFLIEFLKTFKQFNIKKDFKKKKDKTKSTKT